MPTAEAHIETDRPSRYLVHLCKHASAMGGGHGHRIRMHGKGAARGDVRVKAEWSDTRGVIHFEPWGSCTMATTPTTLVLRIEAGGEDGLRQIQEVISADLGRFGRRDELTVSWQ